MIVATGTLDGQAVAITWQSGEPLSGPQQAVFALIDYSADLTGAEVGIPGYLQVDSDYLEYDFGFRHVANAVLTDCEFDDPEPTEEPREGTLH